MLDFMDCDSDGRSSIAYAAQGGQVLTIEWLVNKGASITEVTEAKCSTLMQLAAEHGQLEVVEWLYDEGLKISATDAYGRTALHYAAGSGYLDIVKWLHMKGSNVHTKDETGQTPMYRAIQGKQCLLRVTVSANPLGTGATRKVFLHVRLHSSRRASAVTGSYLRTSLVNVSLHFPC